MKRKSSLIVVSGLVIALAVACGPSETPTPAPPARAEIPAPAEAPSEPGDLVDGVYFATYSHTDSRGWKPQLEIVVENGNVVDVDFDYIRSDGARKTQDTAYADQMAAIAGTYPERFGMELRNRLVTSQSIPVDTVSGATSSTKWFNELGEALMVYAGTGDTDDVVLPMNETYTAELQPDSRGWIATIAVRFEDGEMVSVAYDEVQREGRQVTARKSEDTDYAERWEEATGVSQITVYPEMEQALLETGVPEQVDTISGATSSVDKFREVAAAALSNRR